MRRTLWHVGWSALVVGALILNTVWPLPGQEAGRPWALGMLAYPVAAALLLIRRPGNPIGRLLATVATATGVIFIGGWLAFEYASSGFSAYVEAVASAAVVIMFWAAIALLYLFPTGSPPAGGPRGAFVAVTAAMAVLSVIALLNPDPLPTTKRANPFAGPEWMGSAWSLGAWILPVAVVFGLWALSARYRGSDQVERSQIKWFIAAGIWFLLLVGVIGQAPADATGPYDFLLYPVVVGAFWALPAGILVAVLRYRLYEIDRLVSRSLSYALVVATLAGIYVTVVWVLSRALPANSNIAVSASILTVMVILNPIRLRIQNRVDRVFNRTRFDAEKELESFTGRLRSVADLPAIVADLEVTVHRTLHPEQVSVWLSNGIQPETSGSG